MMQTSSCKIPASAGTTVATGRIHLMMLGQKPVSEGRFGCDYAWNDDFTSYRCMPNRWMPGSDESYAEYQAGYYDHDYDACDDEDGRQGMEEEFNLHPLRVGREPGPSSLNDDDEIPF
jgi:hypothetical protein